MTHPIASPDSVRADVSAAETVTELLHQRAPHDCGICSIAMATGRCYEEVLAAAAENYRPERGIRNEWQVLERLGLTQAGHDDSPAGDFVSVDRGILAPDYFRLLAWGRRALVALPSLNTDGGHLVYWDGARVYDPTTKRAYSRFDELLPDGLTLFREGARG